MMSGENIELADFLRLGLDRSTLGSGSIESLPYDKCIKLLEGLRALGFSSIDNVLHVLGKGEPDRFEIYKVFRSQGVAISEALQLGLTKSFSFSPRPVSLILDDLLDRIARGASFLPVDLGAVNGELVINFERSRLSVDLYVNNKKVCSRISYSPGDPYYVQRRFSGFKGIITRAS
uniref:19 kDa protein n=1 Tax=Grapevine virus A TaxID=35288 RepID=K7QSP9_9VIRU|nr:19 kDa protein [Grapevine virus A]